MRLIDADALKKNCAEVVKASNNSDFIPCPTWNKAMELIDNAPTVEEKSYAMGYQDGLEDGLDGIIPKGEWTIGYTAKQKKLSVCNLCNCISLQGRTNFCHNCGAKMQKGGAE